MFIMTDKLTKLENENKLKKTFICDANVWTKRDSYTKAFTYRIHCYGCNTHCYLCLWLNIKSWTMDT